MTSNLLKWSAQRGTIAAFSALCLLAACVLSPMAEAQCTPSPSGLVAWWKAENNALDGFGSNNGTLLNGGTYATGKVGRAFNLDGVDDYVSIPDSISLQPNQITIEAWVNPTSLTPGLFQEWDAVVSRGASNSPSNPYFLGFTDGRLVWVTSHASVPSGDFLVSPSSVTLGQWHHVAASFDGATKSLFLDGALVASKALASPLIYGGDSIPVSIGEDLDFGEPTGFAFHGLIDEPSLYNRALSAAEIQSIYNAGIYGKCDDMPSIVVNNPPSKYEGSSAAPGSVTFDITLSYVASQTVSVNYQTTNGSNNPATVGSDYVEKHGKVTFLPGETLKRVTIQFIGDSTVELNETFFFDLKTPTNATIADSRGVGQINNDDGPGITIANAAAINEGNSGTTPQTFAVTLSAASANTVTVNWATADGTATTADYVAASGTLTFAPGETSKLITIQVNGDTAVEPHETYKVNLSKVAYAYIADSRGVGTIVNDDVAAISADEPSQ